MRRSEIDGDIWILPPERTKNGERHHVPLSTQVMKFIASVPVIAGADQFVFVGTGNRKFGGFPHIKAALDARIKPKEPWVLHDLRRTAASGMAKIGVKLPVIERVLNHRSGSFGGIVEVYQRHDFAAEKRQALQAWADYVDQIVSGAPTEKVVRGRFVRGAADHALGDPRPGMREFAKQIGAMRSGQPDWYAVAEHLAEIARPDLLKDPPVSRPVGRPKKRRFWLYADVTLVMQQKGCSVIEACRLLAKGELPRRITVVRADRTKAVMRGAFANWKPRIFPPALIEKRAKRLAVDYQRARKEWLVERAQLENK